MSTMADIANVGAMLDQKRNEIGRLRRQQRDLRERAESLRRLVAANSEAQGTAEGEFTTLIAELEGHLAILRGGDT